MKKEFFIFLDIDGVLWDVDYILKEIDAGHIKKGGVITNLKPSCIDTLNYLIKRLSDNYKVNLVISSSWRYNMPETINVLKKYGLTYKGIIDRTPLSKENSTRGKEILEYLSNKENYGFVIIDDEAFDYNLHFLPENIIKTDLYHNSLSINDVKYFLENKMKIKSSR